MKKVGPGIDDRAYEWYAENFDSVNQGVSYILEAFPVIYRRTLSDLKGRFTGGELSLVLDIMNGLMLTPGFAGSHLYADCSDGIALDKLDVKWGVSKDSFLTALRELSISQAACLEIWARAFWNSGGGGYKKPAGALEEWIEQLT